MNAGQILMQPPVGPAAAAPALAALAPEERHAGNFAEVLATMTPQRSAKAGEVGAGSRVVSAGTATADTAMVIPVKQDAGTNGAAELQGSATMAVTSAAVDTDASAEKEGLPETEKIEDGEMPQNVVLCTAGALVAAAQQISGRMPVVVTGVAAQGNGAEIRTAIAEKADVPKPVPAPENPLQPVLTADAASAPVEPVLKAAAASSREVVAEAPAEKVQSQTTLHRAGVEHVVQAPAEAVVLGMPEQSHRSVGDVSPHRGITAEQDSPQAVLPGPAGEKQGMKDDLQPQAVQVQVSSAVPLESPVAPAGKPIGPEQGGSGAGAAAERPAEAAVAAAEATTIPVPAAPVASGSAAVRTPLLAKQETNAVQPVAGPETGQSTPMTEDTAAQAVPSLKGQVAAHPAEFRFSRSAAVEAAVGGHHQPAGVRNQEQAAAMHEAGLTPAGEQQMPDGADGSGGSDAGSTGGNPEGFIQQGPHVARPVQQAIPGTHQLFSVDAASAASLPTQQESARPGSAGNIAGQVRDQLGTHEIKAGSEQLSIRLSPEHLGEIKVNFRLEDQRLKVEIVTENRFAKESLLQHADMLKDSLARQNISMDKFEVTTGGGGGNQGNNAQGEWRELARNRQSQQWLASGGYHTRTAGEIQKPPAYLARPEHAVLDLHF